MFSRSCQSRRNAAACEAVEQRRLLSASLSAGTLNIYGTGSADNISLQLLGATLRVVDNGVNRDFVAASVTKINVCLGAGNDKFQSSDSITIATSVNGGDGKDTIRGGAGDDSLIGGAQDDLLDGRAGKDTIRGQAGNDSISGGSGKDSLAGDDGADTIWGFRDAPADNTDVGDSIHGGNGNDTIYGSSGPDTIKGDGGNDNIRSAWYWDGVLNPATGKDLVYGGDGHDTISAFGTKGSSTIYGGAGNDSIHGGYGSDSIFGEDGEDFLDGVEGVDTMRGGNHNDTLNANSGGNGGIFDQLFGDGGDDLLMSTAPAILHGGSGNDDLKAPQSTMYGDDGDDYLFADGNGNNVLDGGPGLDRGVNVRRFTAPLDTFVNIERFL